MVLSHSIGGTFQERAVMRLFVILLLIMGLATCASVIPQSEIITPASPEKAIDFWLAARLIAALSLLIAAVIDGVADWLAHRSAGEDADEVRPVGIIAYLMIKRLDDLAYGAGLWESVVRGRTVAPLQPQIRF